jgi:hypothetical protein
MFMKKPSVETAFNNFLGELWVAGGEPFDLSLTMSPTCVYAIFGVETKRSFNYLTDFGNIRINVKEPKHEPSTRS